MAITKSAVVVLASAVVAAGTTKAVPVAGNAVDCRGYYGGELTYKITNGASGPTVAGAVTLQASHDGAAWFDYFTAGGDSVASSVTSGSVLLDRGVMYVRAIGYGNTVNAVTVEAHLQAVTAV